MGWIALIAAVQAATATPALKIEQVPGKGHRVTTPSVLVSDKEGFSLRLKSAAASTCGKLKVRWGRFSYGGGMVDGKPAMLNIAQAFSCVDPAADPYKPAPAGWKAQASDDADALAFLRRYFLAFDTVNSAAGLKMMEPIIESTAAEWTGLPKLIAQHRGAGTRQFGKIVWSVNPEDAAHPGIYATTTFQGAFDGLAEHCGVMTLWRRGPGDYFVAQQDIRTVAEAEIEKKQLTRAQAAAVCGG